MRKSSLQGERTYLMSHSLSVTQLRLKPRPLKFQFCALCRALRSLNKCASSKAWLKEPGPWDQTEVI